MNNYRKGPDTCGMVSVFLNKDMIKLIQSQLDWPIRTDCLSLEAPVDDVHGSLKMTMENALKEFE